MSQFARLVRIPPVLLLDLLIMLVVGLQSATMYASKGLFRLAMGQRNHIWWVLFMARRWVCGVPTWTGDDLLERGIQPRGKRQRARAAADPRLALVVCRCSNPKCVLRLEGGLYTTPGHLAELNDRAHRRSAS